MVRLVVTHAGNAHADDFLSAAVLAHEFPYARILRVQEVSEAHLEDRAVVVVDIGGRYEPEKNNYDHHQDASLPCSLHLVLRHVLGYPEDLLREIPSLGFIDLWDTRGPVKAAEKYSALRYGAHPLANALLAAFSDVSVVNPGTAWHETLKNIGGHFLGYINSFREDLEVWNSAERTTIGDVEVVYLPRQIAREITEMYMNSGILVMPHNRPPNSWKAIRMGDDPRVDFNRLRGLEGVPFVHRNGFMAVFEKRPDPGILEKAIVK